MPTITVKDIPEELYARFKEIARQERRSVNAEVIIAMDRLVEDEDRRAERVAALERINTRRRQRPRADLDVVELLRKDRER